MKENMEGTEEEDMEKSVRNRYGNSAAAEHRHLCAVVGAMTQLLKDEGLPPLPTAYFAATMNSINKSLSDNDQDPRVTTALCTFLSLLVTKLPSSFLASKATPAMEVLLSLHAQQGDALPPGAVKVIAKCIASLLTAATQDQNCSWSVMAPSFNIVLNYSLDKRPKVRKCGQECLEQVLKSFQGSLALGKASKAVYALFKHWLHSGNKVRTQIDTEVCSEELKVLHILNTLKLILPLLSAKVVAKLLRNLKALIDIQHPLLMRHIISVLQVLCSCGSAEIPAVELADVLYSISLSVSSFDKQPLDETMFVASFLKNGMQKLHMLDENLCAAKLPGVFLSIAGILATKNEDVVSCAADALKELIQICIDESMVLEGVNRINAKGEILCEDQTPIECICNSVETILDNCCGLISNKIFEVISALFSESSSVLMEGSLKRLSNLQKLSSISVQSHEKLHRCVGSAVAAMGPDKFLLILPLNFEDEDLMEPNEWLLPVLKQHIVGTDLQFFMFHIFPLAKKLSELSSKLFADGKLTASQKAEAYMHSLWDLLPSFCNYPMDTAESFVPLAHIMIDMLKKEPKLHSIITSSLQILIKQNKLVLMQDTDAKDGHEKLNFSNASEVILAEERAKAHYTKKVASKNIKVIASFASELLSVLCKIFSLSSQDKHKELQATIECIASVFKKSVVKHILFHNLDKDISTKIEGMHNEDMTTADRCTVLDLGLSLVQAFGEDEVITLFTVAKSGLQDPDGMVQEKAYKVLNGIFKEHMWFLPRKLSEVVNLIIGVKALHDVSIRKRRLDCLHHLILYILQEKGASMDDTVLTFISEIILTLKNSNKEISTYAYQILIEIGNGLNGGSSGSPNEDIIILFNMIVSYLVGTSSHMISAAVAGLARLVYEFSDFCLKVPNLLPSALILLHSKSREVVKSTLGFMKVVATRLQAEDLKKYLPDILEGLLLWSDDSKNHFKLKVRVVLEILIRKCGSDSVRDIMPQKHMQLFKSIVKQRKEKVILSKAFSEYPEAGDSCHLHANIERSSSAHMSKKRKHEISRNSSMVTKRHHTDACPRNSTNGRGYAIIRNLNVVKDKKTAMRKRDQTPHDSEANVSRTSAKLVGQKKIYKNKRKGKMTGL
ncbi:uncharacterized protein LOC131067795 isoform X2 [Cryptomeria japonica]|uniref:uncharacterized protein LOC131067795 isoform X2 n=1 Tax=Cryptomeria japonica TaxID=3369 RepID=UPI0027DAADEF|nr:uncharacterized protein LOC131067795 isoform X2 [Cryptomeria japonica]